MTPLLTVALGGVALAWSAAQLNQKQLAAVGAWIGLITAGGTILLGASGAISEFQALLPKG